MDTINFKVSHASLSEIEYHLTECSDLFVPVLSSYVDLHKYSVKIVTNAITFEAWEENYLVGLIAAYKNKEAKTFFITNISVVASFQGKTVAKKLLEFFFNMCRDDLYNTVSLEVYKINDKAVSFYEKQGFRIVGSTDTLFLMVYDFFN